MEFHEISTVTGTPVRVKCAGGLNVMSAATGGTVLGTFANDAKILLINETPQNETMFYVHGEMTNGKHTYGWCSGEYLGNYVEYGILTNETELRIRSGVGFNFTEIGKIYIGEAVRILEKECAIANNYPWHKVLYNDTVGYVVAGNEPKNFTFEMRWFTLLNDNSNDATGYIGNYKDFLNILGFKESSNNYSATSKSGSYLGMYQMGRDALIDAGFKDNNGNWTSLAASYGVTSNATFLASPNAQEYAIRAHHKKVWGYLEFYGAEDLLGKTYYNVVVTESGLLAAAHLVGASKVVDAIETNSNIEDGLGTPAYEYMSLMKNYDISEIK